MQKRCLLIKTGLRRRFPVQMGTFLGLILSVFISACSTKTSSIPPQRAVYYWQSTFQWQLADQQKADSLAIDRLYVKFFDVEFSPALRAQPVAVLDVQTPFPEKLEIIPVIYITNDCLLKLQADEIEWLAARIQEKLDELWQIGRGGPQKEIQIDCDWTESTQDRYFNLLNELKSRYAEQVFSVTLRLYPFRYPEKMGVPPVDRAMLMFYNMGELKSIQETNSILNNEIARTYVDPAATYPLPLDIALPAFSWGVIFRNSQFLGLMGDFNGDIVEASGFFSSFAPNIYLCRKDTVWRAKFFREGDHLRIEAISDSNLLSAARLTAPLRDRSGGTVSFFQWNAPNFSSLADEDLETVFSVFD